VPRVWGSMAATDEDGEGERRRPRGDWLGSGEVFIDTSSCATVSLSEAAKVLGIHRSTAWELYKRGEFPVPVLRLGKRLRVTKLQLQRYLLGC
jgi:excisionase family DNA binding protein